jgi:peptidoglycan/LPS O-acetylase OafA/YrhL
VALNTPLSWLTYTAIERPLMKVGRQLTALIAGLSPTRKLATE